MKQNVNVSNSSVVCGRESSLSNVKYHRILVEISPVQNATDCFVTYDDYMRKKESKNCTQLRQYFTCAHGNTFIIIYTYMNPMQHADLKTKHHRIVANHTHAKIEELLRSFASDDIADSHSHSLCVCVCMKRLITYLACASGAQCVRCGRRWWRLLWCTIGRLL